MFTYVFFKFIQKGSTVCFAYYEGTFTKKSAKKTIIIF